MSKPYIIVLSALILSIPVASYAQTQSATGTSVATTIQAVKPRLSQTITSEQVLQTRTKLRLEHFLQTLKNLSAQLKTAIDTADKNGTPLSKDLQEAQDKLRSHIEDAERALLDIQIGNLKDFAEKRVAARFALTNAYNTMKETIVLTDSFFTSH